MIRPARTSVLQEKLPYCRCCVCWWRSATWFAKSVAALSQKPNTWGIFMWRQAWYRPWRLSFDMYMSGIDMYMSYRWRESFNTVRSPSDSWRHHKGDWHVWAQNAKRRGVGGMDHTSVVALTNQLCSDRGVVRVFEYSINVLYYKYGRNQSWRF